ncbi:MAG TPA: hypothetical protein VD840_15980 [Sinorhizobium sp.]|nr:hypothetical protein [Sinorhizobium sp.]
MSNIVVFPAKTPEDRAHAFELQDARDRMILIAAELDKIRAALEEKSAERVNEKTDRASR